MNRWSLVLAAAAASVAAPALAQVTVYGVFDTAVERLDHVGTGAGRVTRMPGLTGSVPSRLGLLGSEDLGGGLRAVFTLEQGFAPDQGTPNQGNRGFGRQAFVGLAGPWGSVTLGRQYSMLFWSQLDADLLGPSAFGSGSLDSHLPNARADNAVAWRGGFGAVQLGATYSLGRDVANAGPGPAGTLCPGESATDAQACRQWSAMAKFDTPAWGLAAAVDEMRGGPGAFAGLSASSLKDRRSTVAGWARVGALKLGAGVIARRNDGNPASRSSRLWYGGAAYGVTPSFMLEAQAFRLDFRRSANQATLLALRATYSLSRRTAVYATAGRIDNDSSLALSVSGAAPGAGPVPGGSQSGLAAGVRHSF